MTGLRKAQLSDLVAWLSAMSEHEEHFHGQSKRYHRIERIIRKVISRLEVARARERLSRVLQDFQDRQ